jgi:hypothetical protein
MIKKIMICVTTRPQGEAIILEALSLFRSLTAGLGMKKVNGSKA